MNSIRLQRSDLPRRPSRCPRDQCIYNQDGICGEPNINKGNGDAQCHRWSNKRVIEMLKPVDQEVT